MKIKLSKSQWEQIGQKTNWLKKTAAMPVSYTGLVPTDSISGNKLVPSQSILSQIKIPEGWTPHAHHMTINMGPSKDPSLVGQDGNFTLVAVGQDDKVIAAKVESSTPSANATPHITIAVNKNAGGKPVMSNNLKEWKPINPISLTGKILQIAQDGSIIS
jgi:hypothetical protein